MLRAFDFVKKKGLGVVLPIPFDVILPRGIATPIEPDLLFIRGENLPRRGAPNFQGVPDWIAEIHSPGYQSYDREIKLAAYEDAGVPELWMIDPESCEVFAYAFDEEKRRYIQLDRGGMEDEVRSRVLPGFVVKVGELFC